MPNRNLILSRTITSERVFHHVRTFVPSRWYKFTLVKEQSYAHERTTQKSA